jgi:hypothetical protein
MATPLPTLAELQAKRAAPAPARTFCHAVAGSTTYTPAGKRLQFLGAPGAVGVIFTAKQDEIDHLVSLADSTSMVTETGSLDTAVKPELPVEMKQAVQDAANTAKTEADLVNSDKELVAIVKSL